MDVETHFVQAGDGPILIGSAAGTLSCACGNLLVQGYEPARFLAVGIQCAKCGTVTATPPLADGILPPRSALIAVAITVGLRLSALWQGTTLPKPHWLHTGNWKVPPTGEHRRP